MFKTLAFTVFFMLAYTVQAQTLQELNAQSTKAYEGKDYAKFLSLAEQINVMRPSHPVYTYNLACAYALNSNPQKAIETLRTSVLMNNKTDFENDADLAALKPLESYQNLIKLKSDLDIPLVHSQKAISLSEKDLHPEGFAFLSKTKTWLVTSIRKGKIVSFDKTGKCTDWLNGEMFSVFSIKSDKAEKYLWVATAAMPEQKGFVKANAGKAEILKVDIRAKKIVQRFSVPGNHVFGDLVVAKNGIIYISDSGTAIIYKIENDTLSEWLDLKNQAFNLQGITLNARQDKIYIADYLKGILEISILDKKYSWLDFPDGTVVKGIDGLLWHDNSLVAIHNGVKPIRIIRYFLNETGDKISNYKVIDNNRPEFDEPALGCIVNGDFYFFANNPWKGYDADFNLDETKFESPMLFKFPL
ncbi:MAG TPA: hypothetical protein VK623_02380 [Flavobacterium sp.]|nr:hypothetical protein [Flavobacterium sp.]